MKRDTHQDIRSQAARRLRLPGKAMRHLLYLLASVIAIPTALVWGPSLAHRLAASTAIAIGSSNPVQQIPGWRVGMLQPDGLRIIPTGRYDASHVLDPEQFHDEVVRHAYWVATQIPSTLNKLYCWCGCENRGEHRSNLQCFEDRMALSCPVCQGTAEIAYQMTQAGIQDAGQIQAAVDAKWAPKG